MVEAIIKAEFALDIIAFVFAACDADRTRALDFRNLSDRGADRTGCCCDDDGLAGLRLADLEQPGIGGHAGPAQHAAPGRDPSPRRVHPAPGPAARKCLWLP